MILYIDTTDFNGVFYAVKSQKKLLTKTYKTDAHKAFEILGKLDEFLKAVSCQLSAVSSIVINKGPGSYTGTRVGAAHALAISLALDIPIKALAKEKFDREFKKTTA